MRKICSITLALLLLVSAMFVVPAATVAAEDDSLLDVSIDFSDSFYTSSTLVGDAYKNGDLYVAKQKIGDASAWDANSDEQYTVIPQATKWAWPPVFVLSDGAGRMLLLDLHAKYRITFKAKIPTAPSETVELHLNENTSTGNAAKGVCLLSTSSAITEWTEFSVDFTSSNWNNTGIMISYWAANSGTNSANVAAPIYIDDITIKQMATVNYGSGSVSVLAGETYEDALAKIPYATALYLDEAKTQVATGLISNAYVTVYPEFDYTDTVVDFSEAFYDSGSPAYNTSAQILDLSGTDDAACGKVFNPITFAQRNAGSSDWPQGAYLANKAGDAAYTFTAGQSYVITMKVKIATALTYDIDVWTATGGTGNMSEEVKIGTIPKAATNGWITVSCTFDATSSREYALTFYSASSAMKNISGVYIDDITVSPAAKVTYGDNNATYAGNTLYESVLFAPSVHTVWYLDEACTKPAVGQVGITNVTLYSKYSASTEVDFDENVYVNGQNNALGFANVEKDDARGNYIKFTRLASGIGGDAADNWAHAVRIADTTGSGYFAVEKGKKYTLTYDYKVETVGTDIPSNGEFGFCVQIINGGLGDVNFESNINTSWKTNHVMPKGEDLDKDIGEWINDNTCTFEALENGYVVLSARGFNAWCNSSDTTILLDNVKIAQVMVSAPSQAGLFSNNDTAANEAAGITGTAGSAVYTIENDNTEYTAFRVFGEYIAPANDEGTDADYGKIMNIDGTTSEIATRHMLLGYKTIPELEEGKHYAMTTRSENFHECWSATPNNDGTYTVRYSLLLKNIPEAYAGAAFNARGAIVTTDGKTIYTNTQSGISAKVLYNGAVANDPSLKWFGGVAGAVE